MRLPRHVVYRSFVNETVLLNLNTGKYHGLNRTAGRMLEILDEVADVEQAAVRLAEEFGQPLDVIRRDLHEFCHDLRERDLIEIENAGA
jgi:hypothetical protein